GREYVLKNDHERAVHAFERCREIRPDDPAILAALGRSLAQIQGHQDRAREMLEKAVELRPFVIDLRVDLALLHAKAGRRSKARELIRDALAYNPVHARARRLLEDLDAKDQPKPSGILSKLFKEK